MTLDVHLPSLNAVLNSLSAACLWLGYRYIKQGRIVAHKRAMLAAFGISTAFLVSYLTHHALHGSTRYAGEGWMRAVYFTILLSHTVLAAVVAPLVVVTLRKGLGARFSDHRKWARWTWPIWIYVSITGVAIYVMLYRL